MRMPVESSSEWPCHTGMSLVEEHIAIGSAYLCWNCTSLSIEARCLQGSSTALIPPEKERRNDSFVDSTAQAISRVGRTSGSVASSRSRAQ